MERERNRERENQIMHQLTFLSDEEGVLSFFEEETEILRFLVYPIGNGEAEAKAQNIGLLGEIEECENIPEIIIRKITKCLTELFGILDNAGLPTVLILAEKATKFEEILGSTSVVQKEYSELMMYLPPERADATRDCGAREEVLRYEQDEEGYICRNADRSFYARVAPYGDGWYVYEVEVKYDRRRTGIATACMGILAERFLQLYLQVGSYNEPAVRLYEKLGFQVIEELCYYGKV